MSTFKSVKSVVCQTGTRFHRFQWCWLHDQKASSVESARLAFCAVLFFLTQEKTRHREYCCEGLSDSESSSSPQKAPSGLSHHPEPSFLLFCLSFVLRICLVWHTFHTLSIVKYPTLTSCPQSNIPLCFTKKSQLHITQWVKCFLFLGRYRTQVCLMVLWQETLVRGLSGLLGAIFLVHWLQIKKDSWVLMSSNKLKLYRRLHCWFHIVTTQPFSITLTKFPFSIIYAHTCWIHYINSNWCNSHKCFSFAQQNSWAHQKYGLELICMDECFLWCPNYGLQNV